MQCVQPVLRLGLNMFDLVLFLASPTRDLIEKCHKDSHLLPNQFSQLNFGKTNLRSGYWQFGENPDYCTAGAWWQWLSERTGPWVRARWTVGWQMNLKLLSCLASTPAKIPVSLPCFDILSPISVWSRKEVEKTSEHPAKMNILYQPKIGHWNWNSNLAAVTPFSLSSEHYAAAICCTCFSVFQKNVPILQRFECIAKTLKWLNERYAIRGQPWKL